MKVRPTNNKILFLVFIVGYLSVNILSLKDGHNWGGDFAQYIIHAQNLLDGAPYGSGIYAGPHVRGYPPGFPLLIAPLLKYFGVNFILLKSLNIFFWLFFVLILFLIFRDRVGENIAVLCSMYLLSSPYFFVFKQSILSDIPFLFFTVSSIFFLDQYARNLEKPEEPAFSLQLLLAALLMAAAMSIRSAGIALFLASLFYLIVVKRALKPGAIIIIAFIITFAGLELFSQSIGRYLARNTAMRSSELSFGLVVGNFFYTCDMLSNFFFFPGLHESVRAAAASMIRIVWTVLSFFSLLIVWRRFKKKSLSLIELYCIAYLSMIILWPYHEGIRLLLPLAGFTLLFLIEGCIFTNRKISGFRFKNGRNRFIIFALLLFITRNCLSIAAIFDYNDDAIYQKDTQELAGWVKTNVDDHENYAFAKPRTLALLTKKTGYVAPSSSMREKDLRAYVDEKNVTFIILHKFIDKERIEEINKDEFWRPMWENSAYTIFRNSGRTHSSAG